MRKRIVGLLLALALLVCVTPLVSIESKAQTVYYWPVYGHTTLSQGYHSGHNGIDIADSTISGADIRSVIGGTVQNRYSCTQQHHGTNHNCDGFGTGLIIRGDDGWYYVYAHMQANSIPAAYTVGAYVPAGATIGKVGTTGNSSGNHLHFSISSTTDKWAGNVNPMTLTYQNGPSTPSNPSVTVKTTYNCDFKVSIPANYKLTLYTQATDNQPADRWIDAASSAYSLTCNQEATLTDGTVRYRFTSGDGYSVYFTYDSSIMSVTSFHSYAVIETHLAEHCQKTGYEVKRCTTCGYQVTRPTMVKGPHSYDNACDTNCNRCGDVRTITHTFDYDCDAICNICNYTRDTQHNYDSSNTCVCGAQKLAITKQPTKAYVKAGATAKFTVKATGDGLKYQWQSSTNGKTWKNCSSSKATSATFTFTAKTRHSINYYRCKVTDSAGNTVYTDAVRLYVLGITSQPTTQKVEAGETVKYTVKATGDGLKYQWQSSADGKTWKNCSSASATSATFTFTGKSRHSSNYYRCRITDSAGNVVYTDAVRLYVLGITEQPVSKTVTKGKTAKFIVEATGASKVYQWQVSTDGGKTWKNCTSSSATKATFTFTGKDRHDGNYYRCRIKDSGGNTVYTSKVKLTVK